MKKIISLTIYMIMFIGIKVDAASFDMTLNTSTTEIKKDSNVDIYITLDNINGFADGLDTCVLNLDYDLTKITINSITGENNWEVTYGTNLLLESDNSAKTRTNIAKINAKIIDTSALIIKNIQCSDGTADYNDDARTLNLSVKQIQNQIENNSNNEYKSSTTVENKKLGIKELSIVFISIGLLSIIIKKIVTKKDMFKKV